MGGVMILLTTGNRVADTATGHPHRTDGLLLDWCTVGQKTEKTFIKIP